MSRAKRRDEWDRFGQLIALVYNRTRMDSDDKPVQFLDVIPRGLVTAADKIASKRAGISGKVTVTAMDLAGIMGVEVPLPTFDELYPVAEGDVK